MEMTCFNHLVRGTALILICEAKPTITFHLTDITKQVCFHKEFFDGPHHGLTFQTNCFGHEEEN